MEGNLLLAVFVLLAAAVALVTIAKAAGLGTILGYLAAGILVGPFGLRLVSDNDLIRHIADFGIVMMLFLIGLEVDARELWRMRNKLLGLGLPQLVVTAAVLWGLLALIGLSWEAALIVGLALAMSSTAIGMQTVVQRGLTRTETGRSTLAILLVQDVAVVPILAAVPVLAITPHAGPVEALTTEVAEAAQALDSPAGWMVALALVAGFAGALLASRFVIRPLMHVVARANVREAFTALGLALVVGAALLTEAAGISAALGAFLGGVLLADSEYRHELESNLEPFKGLLLGLFFVSVGMSIDFAILIRDPLGVLGLVVALVAIKMAVIFALGTLFRMHAGERILLAILLSQTGEFAFVILQFARSAGGFSSPDFELLAVVVALSMATTPILLFLFDRLWAPRLHSADQDNADPGPDEIDVHHRIIVLGYGRFGQIVTRLLRARGYRMTLIDDDPAQISLVKRFGVKVFYGDGARLDILRAAGAADARMVVIAVAGADRILAIAETIRRNFPHVIVAARAVDRSHAHDLMALGVQVFERETFRAAIKLGERALVALGHEEDEARRVAAAFEEHDVNMLLESYEVRHDQAAYVGFVRRSSEMLEQVMRADVENAEENRRRIREAASLDNADAPTEAAPAGIDNSAPAKSDQP